MSDERIGDWIQTAHGRKAYPLDMRPEDVYLDDVAHSLAFQCRFAGHVRAHYSVAEHSVRVSLLASAEGADNRLALAALLHDAAEAYVVDVPRPLKRFLTGYQEIEARVARAIEAHFGLAPRATEDTRIKHWDEVLLATEARDLKGGECAGRWGLRAEPLAERIKPRSAEVAMHRFCMRFYELGGVES